MSAEEHHEHPGFPDGADAVGGIIAGAALVGFPHAVPGLDALPQRRHHLIFDLSVRAGKTDEYIHLRILVSAYLTGVRAFVRFRLPRGAPAVGQT